MQVAVYPDHGWIVEKEVEVTEGMNPVEIAELMWEETYSHHMEFIEQASI